MEICPRIAFFCPKTSQTSQGTIGTSQDDKIYFFRVTGIRKPYGTKNRIFELSPLEKSNNVQIRLWRQFWIFFKKGGPTSFLKMSATLNL